MKISKILIIGNRLLGDSIDSIHSLASLMNIYSESEYHLLTYKYTEFLYQKVATTILKNHQFSKTFYINFQQDYLDKSNSWLLFKHYLTLFLTLKKYKYDLVFIFSRRIWIWIT